MKPNISVIVPFYKTSTVKLSICIESFLQQSFGNFELLMINDGSPQNYQDFEKQYERKDNRIRFIHQKNSGVSAARNNGMKNANGEYVVFCDSDDFVESNFLQALYVAIQDCDLVICGIDEQYYPSIRSKVDMRVFWSTPSQYNWLQYVNFSVNKIYKKSIIQKEQLCFPQGVKLGEDAIFVASYLQQCNRVRCIPGRLYHYVPDADSVVHTFQKKYWDWEENVICTQWKLFHQYALSDEEEWYMCFWLFNKLRGAFYYYIDHEKTNEQHRLFWVNKIMDSVPYQLLIEYVGDEKENAFFSKRDKETLAEWKRMRNKGPIYSYQKDILRRKIARIKSRSW